MRKALAFIGALCASSIAFAYPAVNDSASFTGTAEFKGKTFPMTMQLSILKFDAAKNAYLLSQTTTINGKSKSGQGWSAASDMITPAMVSELLADCASQGGQLQTLTVPAGTFNTCALPYEDQNEKSITWVGDVPFGVVKFDSIDKGQGVHTILGLESFQAGH